MCNLLVWAHQATVDYNYRVGPRITEIAKLILQNGWLSEHHGSFQRIVDDGIKDDRKLLVGESTATDFDNIKQLLAQKLLEGPEIEIGGDPAIAAIRGHLLRLGPGSTDLPEVWYMGLLPESVKDVLEKRQVNEAYEIRTNVFKIAQAVKHRPQSIGLEADVAKLILIQSSGRSISLLAPDGSFQDFFSSLEQELKQKSSPPTRIVLAITAGKPNMVEVSQKSYAALAQTVSQVLGDSDPELKAMLLSATDTKVSEIIFLWQLLREIKKTAFGDRVRTFVGTRDFRDKNNRLDRPFAKSALYLLKEADIISSNDAEIHDLYAVHTRETKHEIPLAYKLRELPFRAIKVCHSADGVIMDLGCRPEHIITSDSFRKDPSTFLTDVLRLAADGATYAMDATAGLGRSANESMIRIYSGHVNEKSRQHERFNAMFLGITEPMPAGMISIPSARVVRTLGAVVGLGAVFDGLLLSFLMRE